METKYVKMNMDMSPRALDELKSVFCRERGSKYELPFILFPEDTVHETDITIVDSMVWLNVICKDISILLKGTLDDNNFHCRSISRGSVTNGRRLNVSFQHKTNDDVFRVNPELKKRLDMWYEYINAMLKKARENTYIFRYEETVSHLEEMLYIRVKSYHDNPQVKNLNVGIADENGEPVYSFGKAERFENGVLTVRTDRESVQLSEGETRIAVYDAATNITCKRMKSGLDKLSRGEAVNKRLSEFLFNPQAANSEVGDNIILSPENLLMKNMNTEQLCAVEGVLNANDLYLIQGPPGTGKTTVIAEICYQNAIRGLKTLVVSQSNLAVDNAISRVMNHSEVRVLRKGDCSRVEEEGLPFVEDNVVRTWIKCVSESASEMSSNIEQQLATLRKYKEKLPEILRYAEDVRDNHKSQRFLESQAFFLRNVMEEADANREEFFEAISRAYDEEDAQVASDAIKYYPSDFQIPSNIYNDIAEKFADIEADVSKIHELEYELELLNEYTSMFTRQMRFISRHVSKNRLDNTAYEGVFYYTDSEIADNLYKEGEGIIRSIPYGIKSIIFRPKWGKVAAIYYRRAESYVTGIQRRTIKLVEKIHAMQTDEEFVLNMETFRFSLDALGRDYDSQYYKVKLKYENVFNELQESNRDYEYSVELLREKTSDKFFSAALENITYENPSLYEIERLVNEYYNKKSIRYLKWQKILKEWCIRIGISDVNYSELKQLYIQNANVIGITCIQSGTADFEKNYPSFDVVIIDESSKSTPPDIILPMLKGKKIVLVGDHKQLPPYIDNDAYDEIEDDNAELHKLMKTSLFEELYESATSDMRTMLFRQYRMHRDIAALINQFYIDTDAGRLESPSEDMKNHGCHGDDISEENHVLWYDIENKEEYFESRQNMSYYNEYEAESIRKLLSKLNANLVRNNEYRTIGVITFYDAQVKLIEDKLIRSGFYKGLSNLELRIGSVDRFQGMEEDIIIISFVRNNKQHNIGFAKDCRRINVALSRAKQLLVIVGCSQNFKNSSDNNAAGMFGQIYSIVQRFDGIRNPDELKEIQNMSVTEKEYRKITVSSAQEQVEEEEIVSGGLNILDYFILKAAYEFRNSRLTVGNIANALGIAPVFVKSRTAYLVSQGMVSCVNSVITLMENGEAAVMEVNNAE